MARSTARPPRAWRERTPARPFTPAEDAELILMARIGLSVDFYKTNLPDRALGELLDRRLELGQRGELVLAPRL